MKAELRLCESETSPCLWRAPTPAPRPAPRAGRAPPRLLSDILHCTVQSDFLPSIKRTKVGKAAGYDRVSSKMVRGDRGVVANLLRQHISKCWKGYRCTKSYEEAKNFIVSRFEKCKTIAGTPGLHSVEPDDNYNLKVRTWSSSSDFTTVNFF
ncbi:hypothetical protein EVAR_491_1 [Eumeta japonica]|uniref:Uncharacterized protein n=1 Tax=Eumeta variegata TaxID=151549 RepID=A0A4C1SDK6_EUMVA|nr:hypothetical protein EVAR_491_1 [Eumeta japonica]